MRRLTIKVFIGNCAKINHDPPIAILTNTYIPLWDNFVTEITSDLSIHRQYVLNREVKIILPNYDTFGYYYRMTSKYILTRALQSTDYLMITSIMQYL